jgi:protein TonB
VKQAVKLITDVLNVVKNETVIETEFDFEEYDEDEIVVAEIAVAEEEIVEEPAFVKVEVMPSFMGGDLNTFRTWFSGEFKIPAIAAENGIQGKVVMKFVIEKDGSVGGIEFLQSPDKVYEDEARRVLMKSPKWTPGRQRGQVVRVFYILPIDCRLQ